MPTTITSGYYYELRLVSSDQNPVVITHSGKVEAFYADYGIGGSAAVDWTITNAGLIEAFPGVHDTADGIRLHGRGTVINHSSGLIVGFGNTGVRIVGVGTIENSGTITSADNRVPGVILESSGHVTNAASGLIDGGISVGGPAEIINRGYIAHSKGHDAYGIHLRGGGTVVNGVGASVVGRYASVGAVNLGVVNITNRGTLSGGAFGVRIANDHATISNQGVINGGVAGVDMRAGGAVTNAAGGTITGLNYGVRISGGGADVINRGIISTTSGRAISVGVELSSGGTLTNSGTINGVGGSAVYLGGTGSNLLVIEPEAIFDGVVRASASASNALRLDAGNAAGTLSGLGTNFRNFTSVMIAAGANWNIADTNSLSSGSQLRNLGTLALSTNALLDAGTVVNHGQITLDASSHLTATQLTGVGDTNIGLSATLTVFGDIAAGESLRFADASATMEFAALDRVAGTIDGFTLAATIDLVSVSPAAIRSITIEPGNTLAIVTETADYDLRLDPTEDFVGLFPRFQTDGHGGTDVTVSTIPCFRAGTRIRTERGEVPVERLCEGDRVRTECGEAATIIWIGNRRVDCRRHPNPENVWPVRILAGSFAPNRPARNLWLSPDHAVFVDGVLIPVQYLINGSSVAQVQEDIVTYYHIELDRHSVLLADGLPAESYLDTGDRANFSNANEAVRLWPEFAARGLEVCAIWEAMGCAPLRVAGPEVERVRQRLAATGQTAERTIAVRLPARPRSARAW